MPDIFREVRILRDEGKLHSRLLNRTRVLLGISAILLAIVIYDIIARGVDWRLAVALAIIGFFFGIFVFSRMNVVQWNEEKEVVESGRMDALGYGVLGLYILSEIGLRTFLSDYFAASATALLLAGVFGVLLGRAIGTVVEIHRVYLASHPA